MNLEEHYRRLEKMYLAAPVNEFYHPVIQIEQGKSTIEIQVSEKFHHAAGAVHGSVYFKMLDDAAFFCSQLPRTKGVCANNFFYNVSHPACFLR